MHSKANLAKRVMLRKSPLLNLIIKTYIFNIVGGGDRWITQDDYIQMVARFYRVLVPDFHGGICTLLLYPFHDARSFDSQFT
jgi:hypothetical protein